MNISYRLLLLLALPVSIYANPMSVMSWEKAIYKPSDKTIKAMHSSCSAKLKQDKYLDCMGKIMRRDGASRSAVNFMRMTQGIGFLQEFVQYDSVIVAKALVIAADRSEGMYLIDRTGKVTDVDDNAFISGEAFMADPDYQKLKTRYPELMILSFGHKFPTKSSTASNGMRLTFSYEITKGCHACEEVGTASIAFEFDSDGKFIQTHPLSVSVK